MIISPVRLSCRPGQLCAGVQVSKERHSGTTGRFRRWEWGKQIKEGQPAYAWGRFITPLYGIKVVGFLADMTYSVGYHLCWLSAFRTPASCYLQLHPFT